MHTTTSTAPRTRRLACLALLGALLVLALTLVAPAFAAQRPDYTGGLAAGDYPTYVANDYTVSALRFSATAGSLYDVSNAAVTTAGVQYYVKIRLTPNADGTPAGTDNRGFTWNPTSQTWAQERADWTSFPIVTTSAGGAITAGNVWYFFRFADTTKAGTYRVLVSLQPVGGGSGTTQNNDSSPSVTVLDMTGAIAGQTGGFVVHNGVPVDAALKGKRAEADLSGSTSPVWALSRSADTATTMPLQFAPELSTGANAVNGDFALAVPVDSAFDARLQNAIWPSGASSFTGSLADVNVALGAAETTPPSAPGALTASPRDEGAGLSWTAATDATGVTAYYVYRWTDAPLGSGYTAMPAWVATVTSGTAYTDSGLTNGTTYHYLVRAVDAATNVGPRSATADVTPDGTAPGPVTGFAAEPGDAEVGLSWTNPTDTDFAGVKIIRKLDSLPADPADGTQVYDGAGTSVEDPGLTNGMHYYYAAFAYDTAQNYSAAATAENVIPLGSTTLTLSAAPTVVNWGKPWALSGELRTADDDPIPGATVDLQASIDGGATWATLEMIAPQAGTSTYLEDVDSPYRKMMYRLVFAGDGSYLESTSNTVTVTPRVKLGTPVAPSSVRKAKPFTAYGSFAPRQPSGSKTVKIKCYLKKNGAWLLKKTVTAKNANSGSASRYSATFSLAYAGSWKLVATSAATAKYAETTSGNEFLKVK